MELLPVFAFDPQACPPGVVNYWGYQPVSFFAPHPAYSSRTDSLGPVDEFRDMVEALHRRASRSFSTWCLTIQPRAITRADVSLPRDRQPDLLHPRRRRPDMPTNRLREYPELQPAVVRDDRRLPALLGHGDARRRLPLRPRVDSGP